MSRTRLYRFHVDNLRSVTMGLKRVGLALRGSVARDDSKNIDVYNRLYALLIGAWAECRLAKLLYEPGAFSNADRSRLREQRTHLARWELLVEMAFRKHHNIPKAELSARTLPHSGFSRYSALRTLLSGDLQSTIAIRNKLAHGQWVYPLTETGEAVAQEQMDALRNENALSLQLKRRLLNYLLDIVHDLAVSKPTFERDFDMHFRAMEQVRQQLINKSYSRYASTMRARYERGKAKKRLVDV